MVTHQILALKIEVRALAGKLCKGGSELKFTPPFFKIIIS